jgi:hypothetical protein
VRRLSTLAASCILVASPFTRSLFADEWNKKTYVTISQAVEVPGTILEPGKYVFKLVDSPSDRNIVQILNERENHVFTTTFAVPKWRQDTPDRTILTFYETPAGQAPAIRAWFYPGNNTGREFVYSKDRADVLAKGVNASSDVLTAQAAPQPAATESEPADLTPATPAQQPAATSDAAAPSDADMNPDHDATPSPAVSDEEDQTPAPAPAAAPEPTPAAQDTPASSASDMPKTAGELPLLGLVGLLALGTAAGLRYARASR